MTDTFDAVLAEMDDMGRADLVEGSLVRDWRDRLAAAHAAEVGERDARIALLESDAERIASCPWRVQKGTTALCQPPRSQSALLARAEAAERDARRYRETLQGIADANYREWDDGVNTPFAFVEWAKSRAMQAIATTEQADE